MSNNYPFNIPPLNQGYPGPPSFMPPTSISAVPVPNIVPQMPEQAWIEYVAQDGRSYYHNIYTKQSTWEKPDEFKTTAEKVLSECPWKEFLSENGRLYYYHSVTKESVWVKPPELIEAERLAYGPSEPELTVKEEPEKVELEKEVSAIDEAIKATLGSYMVPQTNNNTSDKDSSSDEERSIKPASIPVPDRPAYQTKEEMEEGWRQLLRELNVSGNSTWETAVKIVSSDSRYHELKKYNQKKQVFNTYKTQRQKEEREESRLRIKKAKEDLEGFIYKHPKLSSAIGYRKADSLLSSCIEWTAVPDRDRREIYEDALVQMTKREKEEQKVLRKRNIKLFDEILNEMPNLTFKTTWYEAQRILLENPRFVDDEDLQSMDKEDALICFEEHIRVLEKDRDEEKDREKRRLKRQQRKNREAFNVFLDELHEKSKLTSLSMWKDLYPFISRDERFYKMLSQPGSTPLDLFKFYVLSLKSKYSKEKKIVKEILDDQHFVVDVGTTLDNFLKALERDDRGKTVDAGNARMTYTSLMEKAESAAKQRKKEAIRLQRKVEINFMELLKVNEITASMSWEDVCTKLGDNADFVAVTLESDRMKFYKEHLLSVRSRSRSKRSQDTKKKRKHRSSSKDSVDSSKDQRSRRKKKRQSNDSSLESKGRFDSDGESRTKSKNNNNNNSKSAATDTSHKKSKKKKKKKRKHHRQDSSSRSSEVGVQEKPANNVRHASEGEVMDEDEAEVPAATLVAAITAPVKKRASLSSGEMSENELEAEKSKLLAQLQN